MNGDGDGNGPPSVWEPGWQTGLLISRSAKRLWTPTQPLLPTWSYSEVGP